MRCGGCKPSEVWVIFDKAQEWHACTCSTPEVIATGCLVFELSKLRFRGHNLFDGFLKGANKMH